jgi:hypothetical protein
MEVGPLSRIVVTNQEIRMTGFTANKTLALLLPAVLAIVSIGTLTPVLAQHAPPTPPMHSTVRNDALAHLIIQMFNDDQALLADAGKARKDPALQQTYKAYVKRLQAEDNPNFYDPMLYELLAQAPDAPEMFRRYVAFHKATDSSIESIVAENGWPQRAAVGDEAAADFFFLFGHADDDNAWRVTQIATLERVFRDDHVNPRMYAHLCDRLANVAGKPQIYGSVMGPGPDPGTAKLYWPLVDNTAAADARRARIGLPSIEDDLEKFRRGADIGPYMTPLTKGMNWNMSDVYAMP